ncbi:dynamin family protein (plasmid) [Cyanobacterium sp. IPPAS B-1200]|uniref:dynamin family protein n=1 Tax=Cyanobacterium sp. IPPAS B-1200 TaxID=1562720 RepID=UPI000852815B|nr:dynamin family protein [Cyanobacterium sp. IPPAS B-1200]OEJ77729.1 hypothetical protein A5482_15125 [Cyanobacterium sp. IPPAS B-1200]
MENIFIIQVPSSNTQTTEKQDLKISPLLLGMGIITFVIIIGIYLKRNSFSKQIKNQKENSLLPFEDDNTKNSVHKFIKKNISISNYDEFKKYQEKTQYIQQHFDKLMHLVNQGVEKTIISRSFLKEIEITLKKVNSQRFRIAIIGEFSQGKSTLLNAWLGEEIQPARAIPCSGTITILRHGNEKKVFCHYKNGKKIEIPFEEYQEKASIPEDSAIESLATELTNSTIQEIILEHPNLSICQYGIELVDSPGLNEHPDRSVITKQLIKDTDAIVFITNASRPLTLGERELLQEIKLEINNGDDTQLPNNIFMVVNFIDLLRKEEDRQGVQQRIEKLIMGQKPLIQGDNRIHFVSAQLALESILSKTENEYLKSFQHFTKSVETFLLNERGSIRLEQNKKLIHDLIIQCNLELNHFTNNLANQLSIYKNGQEVMFDCIGDMTGRNVKINILINSLVEDVVEQIPDYWNEWMQNLTVNLEEKSEQWKSKKKDKQDRIRHYAELFVKDFSEDFQENFCDKIMSKLLEDYLFGLNEEINFHLQAIQDKIESLDVAIPLNSFKNFKFSTVNQFEDFSFNFSLNSEDTKFLGVFGASLGGAILGGLIALLIPGGIFIEMALAGIGGGAIGSIFGDSEKNVVLNKGLEKINESIDDIYEQVFKNIIDYFEERLKVTDKFVQKSILILEEFIQENELIYQQMVKTNEVHSRWIKDQIIELDQIQSNIR